RLGVAAGIGTRLRDLLVRPRGPPAGGLVRPAPGSARPAALAGIDGLRVRRDRAPAATGKRRRSGGAGGGVGRAARGRAPANLALARTSKAENPNEEGPALQRRDRGQRPFHEGGGLSSPIFDFRFSNPGLFAREDRFDLLAHVVGGTAAQRGAERRFGLLAPAGGGERLAEVVLDQRLVRRPLDRFAQGRDGLGVLALPHLEPAEQEPRRRVLRKERGGGFGVAAGAVPVSQIRLVLRRVETGERIVRIDRESPIERLGRFHLPSVRHERHAQL